MHLSSKLIFAVFLLLLASCEVRLEREAIPLWLGIQLETESSCSAETWQANAEIQELYQAHGWTVEIPIFIPLADSLPIRYPDSLAIVSAFQEMKNISPHIALHFLLQNPFSINEDQIPTSSYLQIVDSILTLLPYSPEKLLFSGYWIQAPGMRTTMLQQFPNWKKQLPTTEIYLAGRPDLLLSESISWDSNYELAVKYDAPPDEQFKPHFRSVNQTLSAKALAHKKKIFIAQTNILGDQKLLLFKNQLRFWEDNVELEGLTINSLYCTTSLADSSTRFGAAKDKDFLEYLFERK